MGYSSAENVQLVVKVDNTHPADAFLKMSNVTPSGFKLVPTAKCVLVPTVAEGDALITTGKPKYCSSLKFPPPSEFMYPPMLWPLKADK
jgi:hypothetical protein